jgi:hypothetical protein
MCVSRVLRLRCMKTPSKEEGELEMDFFKVLDDSSSSMEQKALRLSTWTTDEMIFRNHVTWLMSHVGNPKQTRLVFMALAQSLMNVPELRSHYYFVSYTILRKLDEERGDRAFLAKFRRTLGI